MKRALLFIVALFVFAYSVMAEPVDPDQALQIAKQFVPQTSKGKKVQKKGETPETSTIVYTHKMPKSNRAAFYIVNVGDGSFVLVSADDVAHQILGYSFDKSFPIAEDGTVQLPPHIKGFFDDLAAQIEAAIEKEPNRAADADWTQSPAKAPRHAQSNLPDSVGPLLTTTWNQGQYYNALCPDDSNGPNGHVWAGCAATAMAQIIKYWGYPVHGRGSHSYSGNYGTLGINYAESKYDFDNMPNALTSESSDTQINAVAKLMYDCGVAVSMDYSPTSSGAYDFDILTALINYYNFSPSIGYYMRSMYSDEDWTLMIRSNIADNKPILYSGRSYVGGHAFVIDGYKSEDFYHFNFGWSGIWDGWYRLSALQPGNDYSSNQNAIMNIYPESNSTIIVPNYGRNVFTISKPLDFYNTFGLNSMRETQSNSSVEDTLILVPEKSGQQLVIDFMNYKDEELTIYDGIGTSTLLRIIDPNSNDNDFSPIVSTKNALTILNTIKLNLDGFHLRISENGSCRMVSNITATIEDSSIHLSWVENGTATSWRVEYGMEGFLTGEGSEVITKTNSIVIPVEVPTATYEFRIQPTNDIDNSHVNSIIVNKRPQYWLDVVTEEPEGYAIDSNGNIVISSAEGLAWMAKQSEDWYYCHRNIIITDDIDLSAFLWYPIRPWFGCFYGGGHEIKNMTITNADVEGAGLFSTFRGDSIKDIGFRNTSIYASYIAGTIASIFNPNTKVYNCYSKELIIYTSGYSGGGLFGIGSGELYNCYVEGKVRAQLSSGGIVGDGAPSLYNCYSNIKSFDNFISWKGLLCAYTRGGTYVNCFANIDYVKDSWTTGYIGTLFDAHNTELGYFFGHPENMGVIRDVAGFTRQNHTFAHTVPNVSLNYNFDGSVDLVTALNQGVIEMNSTLLRTWVWHEETGLPVLGDYYEVTYPNVSDISASNIIHNDGFAVALSWKENGSAEEWQIKCLPTGVMDNDSAQFFISHETSTILIGLIIGKEYDIYVRPIYSVSNPVMWGNPITIMVDKPYWVDIVKTRPTGYVEDFNGNVFISTEEALAWLSVCSNGLNQQRQQDYYGKKINIIADLDMGKYKWTPIRLRGEIDGNGCSLYNLYCKENNNEIGFIGYADNSIISNINIINSCFYGNTFVGALIGNDIGCEINGCNMKNITVYGNQCIGGLIGRMDSYGNNSSVNNCYVSGVVYGDCATGGLIGEINSELGRVMNSYSTANIFLNKKLVPESIGGLIGGTRGSTANCYSSGKVEFKYNIGYNSIGSSLGMVNLDNSTIRNVYSISQDSLSLIGYIAYPTLNVSDTTSFNNKSAFENAITIGGKIYTDLLSALNAWVDANNSEGQYRHWVADTENINEGYPIFAPRYALTYKVDGEIYKIKMLEAGTMLSAETEPTKKGYTFGGWSEIPATMPAQDVVVTGSFKINKYLLTYKVDDEVFMSDSIVYNSTLTAITEPTKEGYTFSGWSKIPHSMPAHDVEITGSFTINKYKLTYMIDDKVYKDTVYEYSATIIPEPMPKGNYVTFEWIDLPETMPAHDVTVHASYVTGITDISIPEKMVRIYSPNGKVLNKPQKGLNLVLMRDGTIRKIVLK